MPTEALKAGDLIETATGTDFRIAAITFNAKLVQTYNLTVADLHTFMIGENHAVVHNVNCGKVAKGIGEYLAKKAPTQVSPGTRVLNG